MYQDLGDLEQAKEYQQRALDIELDKQGRNKSPNKVRTTERRKKLYYGDYISS